MTDATWIPGLIVLAVGFSAGLFLSWRLRRQRLERPVKLDPQLSLEIRDLEARREDLYRRLKSAEEDHLSQDEREALETAAARTLMELDRLKGKLPAAMVSTRGPADVPTEKAPVAASQSSGRRPVFAAFASGVLLMAVVGMLIYWANRDAQPRPEGMGGGPTPNAASEPPHGDEITISPEMAARVAELKAQIEANPDDWMAKKELALAYMAGAQFFEAFELSEEILQNFPEDPDGLLVQGVVRMTMGQSDVALNLLDRVLAQHPDHLQAMLYRGLALFQSGQTERAVDTWEMGLQMAGGSHPDFEEVLAMASAQANQSPAAQPQQVQPAPAAPDPPVDFDGYPVQIVLAAGAAPQPGATLFVFLRPEAGAPPVAARRIPSATFPLQFTLGLADSMMGAELPKEGLLVAKLDSDGSASTTSELDLASQSEASWGEQTLLTLGN